MRLRSALLIILCLVASATPRLASAADNKVQAKEAYKEGTRLFDIGEYKQALEAFKKAYLLYEEPAFLFNIAQCYRQLDDKPEAIKFYKTYLRKQPDSPKTADIQSLIANLERALQEEQAARKKPPEGTIQPGTPPPPTAAPPPATVQQPTTPPAAPAVAVQETPPKQEKPVYKKWWLWTIVGGVAVAGVAVGVGVGLSHKSGFNSTLPDFGPASMSGLGIR
jgi:tetratricopeptide (TPR) repeat protein